MTSSNVVQEKQKRLTAVYDYLRSVGAVHSQAQFGKSIGKTASVVSKAMHGQEQSLTANLFTSIYRAYEPLFNLNWLLDGKGEMLSDQTEAHSPALKKRPYIRHKPTPSSTLLPGYGKRDDYGVSSQSSTPAESSVPTSSLEDAPRALSDMFQSATIEASKITELRKQTESVHAETISLRNDLQSAVKALNDTIAGYNTAKEELITAKRDFDSATKTLRQLIAKLRIGLGSLSDIDDIGIAAEQSPDK